MRAKRLCSVVGQTEGNQGFLYSNGNYNVFSAGTSIGTLPFGINNSGQIVGFANSFSQAFVGTAGNFTFLSVPGAAETMATSINNRGEVAGLYH